MRPSSHGYAPTWASGTNEACPRRIRRRCGQRPIRRSAKAAIAKRRYGTAVSVPRSRDHTRSAQRSAGRTRARGVRRHRRRRTRSGLRWREPSVGSLTGPVGRGAIAVLRAVGSPSIGSRRPEHPQAPEVRHSHSHRSGRRPGMDPRRRDVGALLPTGRERRRPRNPGARRLLSIHENRRQVLGERERDPDRGGPPLNAASAPSPIVLRPRR